MVVGHVLIYMKIKTNDKVKIISGKEKGKSGKVIQVFPKQQKLVVEGVNLMKKHMKPTRKGDKGQVIELAGPLHISKAMLICPKCGGITRIGYKIEAQKKKRMCKKCGEIVE